MSSEHETVLKGIEDNKVRLLKVEKELENSKDPARREKLEDTRHLLLGIIDTQERRVLALTLQGKEFIHFNTLIAPCFVIFCNILIMCLIVLDFFILFLQLMSVANLPR